MAQREVWCTVNINLIVCGSVSGTTGGNFSNMSEVRAEVLAKAESKLAEVQKW
jgi:hypothetical protein